MGRPRKLWKAKSPLVIAFAELCLLLHQRPRVQKELQALIGIGNPTMKKYMDCLRVRKLIYVVDWQRRGHVWCARWMWGYKEDSAPKPKPRHAAEHSRNYRQRLALAKEKAGVEPPPPYVPPRVNGRFVKAEAQETGRPN